MGPGFVDGGSRGLSRLPRAIREGLVPAGHGFEQASRDARQREHPHVVTLPIAVQAKPERPCRDHMASVCRLVAGDAVHVMAEAQKRGALA